MSKKHLDDGTLRAFMDGEHAPAEQRQTSDAQVADHLATCERCAARLAELERTAQRVALAMDALAPPSGLAASPSPEQALARARATLDTRSAPSGAQPGITRLWRSTMNRNTPRAIATGLVSLALLIGIFSFAPTRALARQFLSIFRVRRFAVVQVNPQNEDMEYVVNALNDTLTTTEPEVYVDEPVTVVDTVDEARAIAGFDVRMPSDWPGSAETTITVKGRTEMGIEVQAESLQLLFELAGMDPSLAPDDLGDGMVRGVIPGMVEIRNNHCELIQVNAPSLEYPAGVDPALVGEAGLRIMGMGEKEARRISETIDWANTLILPVPTEYLSVRETAVNGHEAMLLIPADQSEERLTLMWEADEVVYILAGNVAQESLLRVAESLYN